MQRFARSNLYININEEMWIELKRKVRLKNLRNFEELWKLSHRQWHLISVKLVKDFYASLRRRIETIIQAKKKSHSILSFSNEHNLIDFIIDNFSV